MPPLLVSIAVAARLLSVGRSTIYELIWRGELSPIHIGRCVRIRHNQLEDLIATRASRTTDERWDSATSSQGSRRHR